MVAVTIFFREFGEFPAKAEAGGWKESFVRHDNSTGWAGSDDVGPEVNKAQVKSGGANA